MGQVAYYRAALSAAKAGDLSAAKRLAHCSVLLEGAAAELLDLLNRHGEIEPEILSRLRELVAARKLKKALQINLPENSKARTIRGLIFAKLGRYHSAIAEFSVALTLDSGNDLAKQAILACNEKKRGLLRELLRAAWG